MSAKLLKSVALSHDENNLRSARQILAEPENFGGEGSGLVDWAQRVVARLAPPSNNGVCAHPTVRRTA
jgi:hypothetical protein